jgi:hypothetical protein
MVVNRTRGAVELLHNSAEAERALEILRLGVGRRG